MRRLLETQFYRGMLFVTAFLFCVDAFAAGKIPSWIPQPADPPVLVNDFAGVLSSSQVDSLERVLVAFDDSTSNQISVVTVRTLAGRDVDEFALRLANAWGIGNRQLNNGVLVLLKPRGFDNNYIDVTIQVGRGLEGAIPDAYASRIIRNIMGPHLRADEYWGAIVKACDEIKALVSGEIKEPRDASEDDEGWIAFGILVLVFLIAFVVILVAASKGDGGSGSSGSAGHGPTILFGPGSFRGGSGSGFGGGGGFGGFGGFGGGSFGGGGSSGRF